MVLKVKLRCKIRKSLWDFQRFGQGKIEFGQGKVSEKSGNFVFE